MNIPEIVITQTKEILESNRENLHNYEFYPICHKVIMERSHKNVEINYTEFTNEQIISKSLEWISYLRSKINELYEKIYKPNKQDPSNGVYVLVHGSWQAGFMLENTADYIREQGYAVYTPTLTGNRPGDDRAIVTLADANNSLVKFIVDLDLTNVILVGHSSGGMNITGAYDIIPDRIKKLVYANGFVPLNGESLVDMCPDSYKILFKALAEQNNDAVFIPFPIWREAIINGADITTVNYSYSVLNPQPYKTQIDKLFFKNFNQIAELNIPKSFINGLQDTALPQSLGWAPRLSERLGLFRLIIHTEDHEVLFEKPKLFGQKIIEAGRD
jgi:pimeloyl-ACP methyl ester carboxylesterase